MRHTVHADCQEFQNVYDLERLKDYNAWAERNIQRLQEAIESVRKYQLELFEHVQEVLKTDFEKVVTIARRTEYVSSSKTKIFYYVRLEQRPMVESFQEWRTVYKCEHDKKFNGTERHTAIRYADELAKAHRCRLEKMGRWE